MPKQATARVLATISAAVYCGAYGTAAVIAHLNQMHQEFYPVYAVITAAALLHLVAELSGNDHTPPPGEWNGTGSET
ncbi:hypothetical protein [Fimbriiglobus ruber]|uniref:Uncharacterized protein n=1 Tax=Fimbriiglobus ruber TaxID=1908690 RepID=A0A225DBJ6_9BACT|nr:hypothetical protein [Fimbriiglobus ruber]OWK38960.1 hypothetical protein FRUB_06336 [Fimbriiglobus ruber]